MSTYQKRDTNSEIDLKELLLTLWHGKIYIILITLVLGFFASLHLKNAEQKYTVQFSLKPVGNTKKSSPVSGLGGFASLAGITLPSSTSNDFKIFKELISSVEVSEIIFKNKELVKNVFEAEWDASINNYKSPSQSKVNTLYKNFENLLLDNKNKKYMPPNAKRLANFISEYIQIIEDKETGFMKIIGESSDPNVILSLIIEATEASDSIMRQRYINFSNEPLSFYKEKLRTARSREHRIALAELIGQEEQKLMFASRGRYFIAEPYINPTISLYPTSPRPKLIIAFSIILGLFLGVVFVLARHAIKKDR